MTHKVRYPKKSRMLLVRDCTVAICNNNNSASVVLSTLLFWHDNPHAGDFYNDQEQTFTMCRTQEEIQRQSCDQVDTKTIHNVAIPFLQLFGFLDIKEKMNGNLYTLYMDRINGAYAAFERGMEALKKFLLSCLQLEKFLIQVGRDQLEKFLIDRKFLQLQLENIRIRNREFSNCKRGRKPRPQGPPDGQNSPLESNRDSLETSNREKERENPSTSPAPEESFIPSSTDAFSSAEESPPPVAGQGGVTLPPASVKGVSTSSASGELSSSSGGDARSGEKGCASKDHGLPIAQNGVGPTTTQESSGAQGYTKSRTAGDSCVSCTQEETPPDSDAVMPNSTVTREQLLSWVKALDEKEVFFALGKPEKQEEAIEKLVSLIGSMRELRDLYDTAREIYSGIIYLTNLTNLKVINAWLKRQMPGQDALPEPSYIPSPQGMTLIERDELVSGALAYCPDFVINGTLEAPYFVAIWESEESIIEMGHPDDWSRIPQARLDRAAEFGARYWQEQPLEVAI